MLYRSYCFKGTVKDWCQFKDDTASI